MVISKEVSDRRPLWSSNNSPVFRICYSIFNGYSHRKTQIIVCLTQIINRHAANVENRVTTTIKSHVVTIGSALFTIISLNHLRVCYLIKNTPTTVSPSDAYTGIFFTYPCFSINLSFSLFQASASSGVFTRSPSVNKSSL